MVVATLDDFLKPLYALSAINEGVHPSVLMYAVNQELGMRDAVVGAPFTVSFSHMSYTITVSKVEDDLFVSSFVFKSPGLNCRIKNLWQTNTFVSTLIDFICNHP